MTDDMHMLDLTRSSRTGLDEAIFCLSKTVEQIGNIIESLVKKKSRALLTHLSKGQLENLPLNLRNKVDYHAFSKTGLVGEKIELTSDPKVAIVSAGTSDLRVASEAARTLAYYGEDSLFFNVP